MHFWNMFWVLSVLVLSCFQQCICHVCKMEFPLLNETVTGIDIDPLPSGYREKRSSKSNMRIYLHYTNKFNKIPEANMIKKEIVEPAIRQVEGMLAPKIPVVGILRVPRSCCNSLYIMRGRTRYCMHKCNMVTQCIGVNVPSRLLKRCYFYTNNKYHDTGSDGEGVKNYDLIVLVSIKKCKDSRTEAIGAACFQENQLDRPILGTLYICERSHYASMNKAYYTTVIIHEMIHILGFSKHLYAYFRDQNGKPLVPRNAINAPSLGLDGEGYYAVNEKIGKYVYRQRENIYYKYSRKFFSLTLPSVVAVAKKHFNCRFLNSVDLEDHGGDISHGCHFDEYLLGNELMTPVINNRDDKISMFTLMFLKDTGWYNVRCKSADYLSYGYHAGCTFLDGCYLYMKKKREQKKSLYPCCEFVDSLGHIFSCNMDHQMVMQCGLIINNRLNQIYQYFSQGYGGYNEYQEYCPVYVSHGLHTDCLNPNGISRNDFAVKFEYGPNSRCLINDISYRNTRFGASCFKVTCNNISDYSFHYLNEKFVCTRAMAYVITKDRFKIYCADPKVICQKDYMKIKNCTDNESSVGEFMEKEVAVTKDAMNMKYFPWIFTICSNAFIFILF